MTAARSTGTVSRRLVAVLALAAGLSVANLYYAQPLLPSIAHAFATGSGSVVAHLVVPLAAELAPDTDRGRMVGTVMSGLLLGILLGRTAAGAIAGLAGWRVVYAAAPSVMVALAIGLRRELPSEQAHPPIPYLPVGFHPRIGPNRARPPAPLPLRGALFAAFSVFWTSVAFMLAGPPYRYGDAVIGLFGLVGAAGALCASVAGRLADAGRTSPATGAFSLIIALSFAVCAAGRSSLVALVVGVVLLDVGCQGLHVLNHSTIYGLGSGASRLNSAYMTSFFLGGAAGSAASAALYGARGWGAVCLLGATLGLAATLLWASERRERLPGTGAMSRPPAG